MYQSKIEIIDYVPKFLNFYEKAKGKDEKIVWDLWKEHNNFAAVPPGEQGEKKAKDLLRSAWDKYPEIIANIEKWRPDREKIEFYLKKVKDLLNCKTEIDMVLVYFVGAFDNNAFVAPYSDGRFALCLPIEGDKEDITLVHELTHIVHSKTAKLSVSWQRSVGAIIIQEGLAMQVSKYLLPGKLDEVYTEHKIGWLNDCEENVESISDGILPYLEESSYEKVYQFTMGQGSTGKEREAYFVGWKIVHQLLMEGMSFEAIAKIRETEMPELIRRLVK